MTRKRIGAYATIMAATLWTVWAVDFSVPGVLDRLGKIKGTDFLQFYVSGSFVRAGRSDQLYDLQAQIAAAQAVAPTSHETIYLPLQTPQTALAAAPLSALPYPPAVGIWIALIVLLYAASCWMTWTYCTALHAYPAETLAFAAACPALFGTVLFGQTSAASLFVVAATLLALARGRPWVAGLALGCLAFKPHWLFAVGAVFLFAREWRVVMGTAVAAVAQMALTVAAAGGAVMRAYVDAVQTYGRLGDLIEPYAGNSLRGFFSAFVPFKSASLVLYVLASLGVLAVAARIWRSDARSEVRFATLPIAAMLISPHAHAYDLLLLVPVFFLLANWLASRDAPRRAPSIAWALCALYIAPLFGGLPTVIRLQFSVTAMALLLFYLHDIARRPLDAESVTHLAFERRTDVAS